MAISLNVYSNVNNSTKSVSLDFIAETATISGDASADTGRRYFFKLTTNARDTNNLVFTPRIVEDLSDLALNKQKQSASNVAAAYTNVKSMVIDYLYDYINGHEADQYLSGVTGKAPMKFS